MYVYFVPATKVFDITNKMRFLTVSERMDWSHTFQNIMTKLHKAEIGHVTYSYCLFKTFL